MTPVVFHVLLALADGDSHAYQIMKDVPERTGGAIEIGPGSLHYTLGKLLDAELVEESDHRPRPDEDDPRRKYYRLTTRGREVLSAEAALLADIVDFAFEKGLIPERGSS
ncbi:MAG: PadR family transcriptional regulator [Longimicrobiales bacterium]|nr:PadR family transcriptional regulator [Longimicrobiales bacterium]